MFKMTNGLATFYLQTLQPQRVQQQSRDSLRNSHTFTIPLTRTVSYFNSFLPTSLREWNSLDQTTRDCATLGMFKRKLGATLNVQQHWARLKGNSVPRLTCSNTRHV